MSLGQNIAKIRKSMGLTQEQLAEKCEVSRQAVTKWESGESEPAIAKLVKLSEILKVSIDELIMGNSSEMFYNKKTNLSLDYKTISAVTGDLTMDYPEHLQSAISRKLFFELLYDVIKTKYLDSEGRVFDEYLLENTSAEERKQSVKFLMFEHQFAESLLQEYIDGTYELNVAFDKIEIAATEYFNTEEKQEKAKREISEKKHKSQIAETYLRALKILYYMQSFEDYTEKKLGSLKRDLYDLVDDLDERTQVGRLMVFYLKCAEEALDKKDASLLKELMTDWRDLKEFILDKINVDA